MQNSSSHLMNMDDECEIDVPVFVELKSSNCIDNELGMFCKTQLNADQFLGSYKGKIRKSMSHCIDPDYVWTILSSRQIPLFYIDASDPRDSNWLRFIRWTSDPSQYNVICMQQNQQINYFTLKEIHPGEELVTYLPGKRQNNRTGRSTKNSAPVKVTTYSLVSAVDTKKSHNNTSTKNNMAPKPSSNATLKKEDKEPLALKSKSPQKPSETDSGEKSATCDICSLECHMWYELKMHMYKTHINPKYVKPKDRKAAHRNFKKPATSSDESCRAVFDAILETLSECETRNAKTQLDFYTTLIDDKDPAMHATDFESLYRCHLCENRCFMQKTDLRKHLLVAHKLETLKEQITENHHEEEDALESDESLSENHMDDLDGTLVENDNGPKSDEMALNDAEVTTQDDEMDEEDDTNGNQINIDTIESNSNSNLDPDQDSQKATQDSQASEDQYPPENKLENIEVEELNEDADEDELGKNTASPTEILNDEEDSNEMSGPKSSSEKKQTKGKNSNSENEDSNAKYTCNLCKKQFDDRVALSRHQRTEMSLKQLKKKKDLRKKKWRDAHWKRKIDLSYIETTALANLPGNIADNLSFCIDGTSEDLKAYHKEVKDYLMTELGQETDLHMFLKCFPELYEKLASKISPFMDLNLGRKANAYFTNCYYTPVVKEQYHQVVSKPAVYHCKNCRAKFKKLSDLVQHQRSAHSFAIKTSFDCYNGSAEVVESERAQFTPPAILNYPKYHSAFSSPVGYLRCDPYAYLVNLHLDSTTMKKCDKCANTFSRSAYRKHLDKCGTPEANATASADVDGVGKDVAEDKSPLDESAKVGEVNEDSQNASLHIDEAAPMESEMLPSFAESKEEKVELVVNSSKESSVDSVQVEFEVLKASENVIMVPVEKENDEVQMVDAVPGSKVEIVEESSEKDDSKEIEDLAAENGEKVEEPVTKEVPTPSDDLESNRTVTRSRKRSLRVMEDLNSIITSKRPVMSIKSAYAAENFVFFDSKNRKQARESEEVVPSGRKSRSMTPSIAVNKKIKLEKEESEPKKRDPKDTVLDVINSVVKEPVKRMGRPRKSEPEAVKTEPQPTEPLRTSKRIRKESLKKIEADFDGYSSVTTRRSANNATATSEPVVATPEKDPKEDLSIVIRKTPRSASKNVSYQTHEANESVLPSDASLLESSYSEDFSEPSYAGAHSVTVNSAGKKMFLCEKCGLEFTSPNSVTRHQEKSCLRIEAIVYTDKNGKVTKKCPACSEVFEKTHSASIHIFKHHRALLGPSNMAPCAEAVRLHEAQIRSVMDYLQKNKLGLDSLNITLSAPVSLVSPPDSQLTKMEPEEEDEEVEPENGETRRGRKRMATTQVNYKEERSRGMKKSLSLTLPVKMGRGLKVETLKLKKYSSSSPDNSSLSTYVIQKSKSARISRKTLAEKIEESKAILDACEEMKLNGEVVSDSGLNSSNNSNESDDQLVGEAKKGKVHKCKKCLQVFESKQVKQEHKKACKARKSKSKQQDDLDELILKQIRLNDEAEKREMMMMNSAHNSNGNSEMNSCEPVVYDDEDNGGAVEDASFVEGNAISAE